MFWNNSLKSPVILSMKKESILRIIRCFFYAAKRTVTIGLAGESASGKTTVCNEIIKTFETFAETNNKKDFLATLTMDNYYYDRSKEVIAAGGFEKFVKNYDLDSPTAFELTLLAKHLYDLKAKQKIYTPKYDMSGTAKRFENEIPVNPAQIIVVEGLYTLNDNIENSFDIKVYIDVNEDIRKKRWYMRAKERGMIGEGADIVFNNATEKAKIHIRPSRKNADIVLNGEATIDDYGKLFTRLLKMANTIENCYSRKLVEVR